MNNKNLIFVCVFNEEKYLNFLFFIRKYSTLWKLTREY